MIDHVRVVTNDVRAEAAFYEAALKPLGYEKTAESSSRVKFANLHDGDSIIVAEPHLGDAPAACHFAFVAADKQAVTAFYQAGLAAGGTDNGGPGPRPNYGPHYYAAFIHDPDGNNVEAVYRG